MTPRVKKNFGQKNFRLHFRSLDMWLWQHFSAFGIQLSRAARLQNEIAPEDFVNQYENGFKNAKTDPKNDPKETCPKYLKPLSRRLKMSHRHFFKSFSPPKICTMFFFHREGSARGATLTFKLCNPNTKIGNEKATQIPARPKLLQKNSLHK